MMMRGFLISALAVSSLDGVAHAQQSASKGEGKGADKGSKGDVGKGTGNVGSTQEADPAVAQVVDKGQGKGDSAAPGDKGQGKGDIATPGDKGQGKGDSATPGDKGQGKGDSATPGDKGKGKGNGTVPGDKGKGKGNGTVPGDKGKGKGNGTIPGDKGKGKGNGTAPGDKGKGKGNGTAPGDKGKGKGNGTAPGDKGHGRGNGTAPGDKGKGKGKGQSDSNGGGLPVPDDLVGTPPDTRRDPELVDLLPDTVMARVDEAYAAKATEVLVEVSSDFVLAGELEPEKKARGRRQAFAKGLNRERRARICRAMASALAEAGATVPRRCGFKLAGEKLADKDGGLARSLLEAEEQSAEFLLEFDSAVGAAQASDRLSQRGGELGGDLARHCAEEDCGSWQLRSSAPGTPVDSAESSAAAAESDSRQADGSRSGEKGQGKGDSATSGKGGPSQSGERAGPADASSLDASGAFSPHGLSSLLASLALLGSLTYLL